MVKELNSLVPEGAMSAQEVTRVPLCIGETISDEIEQMYDEITRRAYANFQERGGNCTLDLEDWLMAERELLFKPKIHIEETKNRRIVVTVYIGDVTPAEVHLLVTPNAMLVHAPSRGTKQIFRAIQFPRPIDVTGAEATYGDGCLVLTA